MWPGQEQLAQWLARPLGELDLAVVMIDGIHFRDRVILLALGIDAQGHKHVLGLREGSTEATRVVASLLSDLIDRGLDAQRMRLWVIDGGKALRKAIQQTFGATALHTLGITGALQRTLRTTNPIENLNCSVAHYCRNVKRWRDGQMVLRWVARALSDASTRMCKLRGCSQMCSLIKALDARRSTAAEGATLKAAQHVNPGAVTPHGSTASGTLPRIEAATFFAAVSGVYLFGGYRSSQVAMSAAPAGLRSEPAALGEFAPNGLQVEVSLCGQAHQPCVRVDPKSQTFGAGSRRETYQLLPAK